MRKESQCEVKTYELGGNNETEYSQSDGGVLYVFGDHNILRKVFKCDPYVYLSFDLIFSEGYRRYLALCLTSSVSQLVS